MPDKNKKRKVGRPPVERNPIPVFDTDADFRNYLLNVGLEVVEEMKEQAMRRNNVKSSNASLVRAKATQHKTVLEAIKTLNSILKDKQIDLLEVKLNSLAMGIVPSSNQAIELNDIQKQFEKIKEV